MKTNDTITIPPFEPKGNLQAPASKSAMQRVLALALLNEATTTIHNPGKSNDDNAALEIIKQLGATIIQKDDSLEIHGVKTPAANNISAGESGLSVRMFTPIVALSSGEINFSGKGSLLQRPMDVFEKIFPKVNVKFSSNNGKLPFSILGPLRPANIKLDGSLSSQFLTGFLIAFAKAATEPVTITVNNLKSKPYVDLTVKLLREFGYEIENDNDQEYHIIPKREKDSPVELSVEADWSGAAFLLVAAAIGGRISLRGLDTNSVQGDKKILEALKDAGANLKIDKDQIEISKALLNAFSFDATDCPDLFPPLVALAACCNGISVITGTERLTHKESNRALTLKEQFGLLGIKIENKDNQMFITGSDQLQQTSELNSCNDHRIAMALAVMATVSKESIILKGASAIDKSYPGFYEDLNRLGANIIVN